MFKSSNYFYNKKTHHEKAGFTNNSILEKYLKNNRIPLTHATHKCNFANFVEIITAIALVPAEDKNLSWSII